jgi:hypothetical protein
MAALGDLIIACVVVFVAIAALSLMITKPPATPSFARRAATSANPQLRQDTNAGFLHDRGFLFRRRIWFTGTCCPPVRIDSSHYHHFAAAHPQHPVPVARSGPRAWWWFEDSFYWESGGHTQRDVLALIRDRQRKAAQRLDRAHMLLNVDEGRQQPPQRTAPAHPPRSPPGSLRTRRRPVRRVRQQIRPSIRPPHPGGPRRRQHGRQPAAPLRGVQPPERRRPVAPCPADLFLIRQAEGIRHHPQSDP